MMIDVYTPSMMVVVISGVHTSVDDDDDEYT